MRKFNLKDIAAKRMMDPEGGEKPAAPAGAHPECPVPGFSIVSRTDVGRVRKNNQDALIIGNGLAGVADGMGGHNGGEIASGGTRDGLLREIQGGRADRTRMEEAVQKINLEIWEQQEKDASLSGMGTTLTLLWPGEKEMLIAQIGDSRAYLLREGTLRQVTQDHSLVGDMVRRGILTEEQAACHPMRNYITRAVGTDDHVEVDLYTEERRRGDRWLVCSDGLYGLMSRAELTELLSIADAEEAANRLLQTALENGGRDNISLILLNDETGPEETALPDAADEPKGEAEA